MTNREAKRLKVGDRVRWPNPEVGGEVVDVGYSAVTVKWDDGQTGTVDIRDMAEIGVER